MKLAIAGLMLVLTQSVHADFFDLSNQEKSARQAKEDAKQNSWNHSYDRNRQALLTQMANDFAAKHGGFSTPVSEAKDQTASYFILHQHTILEAAALQFSTADKNECVLTDQYYEDDNSGFAGTYRIVLHCINARTHKHTDIPRAIQ